MPLGRPLDPGHDAGRVVEVQQHQGARRCTVSSMVRLSMRPAVGLGLLISQSVYKCSENAYGFVSIAWYGQRVKFEPERFTDDPYAATRRAIVRAAAEIGRSGEASK